MLDFAGGRRQWSSPAGDLEFYYTAPSSLRPRPSSFNTGLRIRSKSEVAENRRLALYTNLKPGKYTFHVIAANADGFE